MDKLLVFAPRVFLRLKVGHNLQQVVQVLPLHIRINRLHAAHKIDNVQGLGLGAGQLKITHETLLQLC